VEHGDALAPHEGERRVGLELFLQDQREAGGDRAHGDAEAEAGEERHGREDALVVREPEGFAGAERGLDHALVAEPHALGVAHRARRVELRQIVGGGLPRGLGAAVPAPGDQILEPVVPISEGAVVVPTFVPADRDQQPERRQVGEHAFVQRERVEPIVAVGGDEARGAGLAELVPELVGPEPRVDGDDDGAERGGGAQGEHPLRAVGEGDRDPVAGRHPQVGEGGRQSRTLPVDLRVAQRARAGDDQRALGPRGGAVREKLVERGVLVGHQVVVRGLGRADSRRNANSLPGVGKA
jgi:hypothetical protein